MAKQVPIVRKKRRKPIAPIVVCSCIEKGNAALLPRGEEIDVVLRRAGDVGLYLVAVVGKRRIEGNRQRRSTMTLVASFCPFCGLKYPEASHGG